MDAKVVRYQFDDVVVDAGNFRAERAGVALDLEPKALRVLLFLVENRGRVVAKEELVAAVWADTFVTDNALTRLIAQLRKQLGDSARESRVIETVPTVGYRFLPEVRVEREEAGKTPPRASGRQWRWVAGLACVLVAIGWGVWWQGGRTVSTQGRLVQLSTSNGLDLYPSFSPDGASVAYASDRSGAFEIYVRPLTAGGREIQVTRDGTQNLQPAWSPDGRYLAFCAHGRGGIWVVPALGGAARQLSEFGSQPSWSPDGKQVAFRSEGVYSVSPIDALPSGASTIWTVGLDGGAPRQMTKPNTPAGGHSFPVWARDGKQILFAVNQAVFRAGLWAVDVTTLRARELKMPQAPLGSLALSPDGRWLYYVAFRKEGDAVIARVAMKDGEPAGTGEVLRTMMAATMPRELSISSDGTRMVFGMGSLKTALHTVRIRPETGEAVGAPAELLRNTSFRNSFPVFSPEGSRIAFFSRPMGDSGNYWVMNADGSNAAQLSTSPHTEHIPSWMPDGSAIATMCQSNSIPSLCMLGLDGSSRSIQMPVSFRSWGRLSPDGRELAFQREGPDGHLSVWKIDVNTKQERRVAPEKVSIGFPSWSNDGRWIAGEIRDGGDTHLAVVPGGGGEPVQLTTGREHAWPASWAPDNDRIAYAGFRGGIWNLYWTSRTGRTTKRLTNNESLSNYVRYPAWSPRNDQVVYEQGEMRGNIYLLELR
jgi:Tol biopolymer transport system component/DNA-binding winged helix-turn-helix (wHTH) protein